jgi:hypothetical protein
MWLISSAASADMRSTSSGSSGYWPIRAIAESAACCSQTAWSERNVRRSPAASAAQEGAVGWRRGKPSSAAEAGTAGMEGMVGIVGPHRTSAGVPTETPRKPAR